MAEIGGGGREGLAGQVFGSGGAGTEAYFAPEIVRSLATHPDDPKLRVGGEFLLVPTDWWAFGCLMHQLLTGDIPFYADDVKTNRKRILADKPKFAKFLGSEVVILI